MAAVLVIDASVAVRLVTHTCGQDDWGAQLEAAALVLAPELMLTDAANALWKLRRSNALQQVEPDRTLQAEALALAMATATLPWTQPQPLPAQVDLVVQGQADAERLAGSRWHVMGDVAREGPFPLPAPREELLKEIEQLLADCQAAVGAEGRGG